MLDSLSKKQKLIFFIILSFMLGIILYYIYSTIYTNSFFSNNTEMLINNIDLIENSDNNILTFPNTTNSTIVVYICGEVKESKVITLNENSRICDAIDAAGGLTSEADLTTINLAYILEDGEKIYIPKKGEEFQNIENSSYISSTNLNTKININKATQTELETIPGIGPSTALKIINYRKENGKFSKIEEIKNVSGIGDAKFNNIKNYICTK